MVVLVRRDVRYLEVNARNRRFYSLHYRPRSS